MTQRKQLNVDVIIFGAGISGLWLLNRLRAQGYHAILLEKNTIGGIQTINSQGIIHGGAKFSLTGSVSKSTSAIREMPNLWSRCLASNGEIDLSQVNILSNFQYLWSANKLPKKFNQFLLSQTLHTKSTLLQAKDYPYVFAGSESGLQIFRIAENVLDMRSLVENLSTPYKRYIIKIEENGFQIIYEGAERIKAINLVIQGEPVELKASRYIFTAGEGNKALISGLENPPRMQLRPLQMTIAHWTNAEYPLYGHCLGRSATPELTVTTHHTTTGKTVWYLGGQLAENGAKLDENEHLQYARAQLKRLFPWLDSKGLLLHGYRINRAEIYQPMWRRPATESLKAYGNMIIGWPTKLTLAPILAQRIMAKLQDDAISPQVSSGSFPELPHPKIAKPAWDI